MCKPEGEGRGGDKSRDIRALVHHSSSKLENLWVHIACTNRK